MNFDVPRSSAGSRSRSIRLAAHAATSGAARGYTLVEIGVVLAMIGVLAALAIYGYRRWIASARVGTTKDILQGIMLAEHMYYQDTQGYLSCSSGTEDWYPMAPNGQKHAFHDPAHTSYPCFKALMPETDAPLTVSVSVVAGTGADTPPDALTVNKPTWPDPTKPWYVIHAASDEDGDGIYGYWVGASFSPNDIYSENDGE
jgi:type IV pilus assembly protein PilA